MSKERSITINSSVTEIREGKSRVILVPSSLVPNKEHLAGDKVTDVTWN